jgi:dipeptidyl aminopeptidase/acylaminoacyl peptidase
VDSSDPPFLIVHGDADEIVPWDQSVRLHRALAEAGVDASLWIIGRAGHGGFPLIVDDVVRAFFDRVLRGVAG